MQSLTEYMKKEIIFYIKQEHDKGHSISKIKKSLLEGGHHKNLVKEAMDALKRNNFNVVKALEDPIKKHLDQELYYDIMNSLIRYIEYQLNKGYTKKKIKKILADYGHSEDMIKNAFDSLEKGKLENLKEKVNIPRKVFEFGFIFAFIIFLVFISGATMEPFEIILFSFSPIIFTIIGIYISGNYKIESYYLWMIPISLVAIFGILTTLSPDTARNMETLKISFLNLLLGLLFVYIKQEPASKENKDLETLSEEVKTENDKDLKN